MCGIVKYVWIVVVVVRDVYGCMCFNKCIGELKVFVVYIICSIVWILIVNNLWINLVVWGILIVYWELCLLSLERVMFKSLRDIIDKFFLGFIGSVVIVLCGNEDFVDGLGGDWELLVKSGILVYLWEWKDIFKRYIDGFVCS